jgi:uncharacterized protein YutE (UPF0331/DUF86 family)
MIDRNIALAKLAELDHRVRRVETNRKPAPQDYVADASATELTAFNVMLAVQCASDLALHTIADEEWSPASTNGEAFDRLAEHGVIAPALAAKLRRAVGFRNAVAHGDAQLRLDLLHVAATDGVGDLRAFSMAYATWLMNRS